MDLSSQRERIKIRTQLLKEINQLKSRRGFLCAGFPSYTRLFGRDALITAWQLLPWNSDICKATLEALSQEQGRVFHDEREEEPGKILHETDLEFKHHPEEHFPFPYYGAVDSTPLFLTVFNLYFQKTKDRRFLERHWDNILMALHWMQEEGCKEDDHFLRYERRNPKGLFHQGWKDGFKDHLGIKPPVAIVEAQGYQYSALMGIAALAEMRRVDHVAEELREKAENLKKKFHEEFWMKKEKYFALALDKTNHQRKAITSNPGHCLFTGIIGRESAEYVVSRLFEDDMWTPFGIRTHSMKEPDFDARSYHLGSVWPHDNWIIAQGLRTLGFQEEYDKIKTALFAAKEKLGILPELYGVVDGKIVETSPKAAHPQAWATGALFNFLEFRLQDKILSMPSRLLRR